MTASTLSPKYQIVIPKEIRRHHKLRPGQKIQVLERDGEIVLRPIPRGEDLIGLLKDYRHIPFERDEDRTFD